MNPHETLTAKSLRALKWNYLGTVARVVLQFGSQIALARLVGPDATGVFAYAFLTVGLCALVVEMGLGAALAVAPASGVIGNASWVRSAVTTQRRSRFAFSR